MQTAAVEALAPHPYQRRTLLVRNQRRFATPDCVFELLSEARRHRIDGPDRARRWAHLAWIAAERSPWEGRRRLQALAAAELGNALRLLGDWPSSIAHFRLAQSLAVGCPAEQMEVDILHASLLIQQERWVECWDRLQRASDAAGDDQGARYRIASKRGIAAKECGRFLDALELFREARELAGEPAERLAAMHNAVTVYADAGWWADGLDLYRRMEPHHPTMGELWCGRAGWLHGRLLHQAGDADAAARELQRARETVERYCRYWDLAEIVCDEADAWLAAGRPEEVVELAVVAETAFRAVGLEKRAARAAGLLRAAGVVEGARAVLVVREMLRARRVATPGALTGQPSGSP